MRCRSDAKHSLPAVKEGCSKTSLVSTRRRVALGSSVTQDVLERCSRNGIEHMHTHKDFLNGGDLKAVNLIV